MIYEKHLLGLLINSFLMLGKTFICTQLYT